MLTTDSPTPSSGQYRLTAPPPPGKGQLGTELEQGVLRSDRKQAEQAQTFAQPSAQPTTTARCDNPMELPRVHRRPELVPAAARAAEPRPAAHPELVPTAPAAAAARPSRRAAVCCTRQRADLSFDLVTAGVSLADIVTDILVALLYKA